jgi:hypothetical protein
MVFKIEINSLDDICLIRCALSVYYNQVHPDNSCRKNIVRLIETFSNLNEGGSNGL